jgi:hypothetical protein
MRRLGSPTQELRGSALRLLATGLAPSPLTLGARSNHWPSIRVALEGLGLSTSTIAGCKQFLLQVQAEHCNVLKLWSH